MADRIDIHDMGKGRWRSILIQMGVPADALTGRNTACPCCGGKDRFRWTNLHQRGGYFCNGCGPGSAVDLVMKIKKWDFRQAKAEILKVLDMAPVELPKAGSPDALGAVLQRVWDAAQPLTGLDPVTKYLAARGIKMREAPKSIRWHRSLSYHHEDGRITRHHAMVAKYVAPSVDKWTLHYTYLDDCGRKAALPKNKLNAKGPVPRGGAVRLAYSAETMGVAEGLETALSAQLLYDVPVWSALSAGGLVAFEPPQTCKNLIVFGDCDESYTGQSAAYALAHRLKSKGLHVDVRLPPEIGTDFNDLLQMGVAA